MPSRLTRRVTAVLVSASIVAIAAGCASSSASPRATPGSSPNPPPTTTLTDTAWTVVSINGAPMLPEAAPTMAFSSDGQVAGSGGCNQYSAPYQTDGDKLTVGPMASTLMLCEGAIGAQETAFFNGLGGASSWLITAAGDLEINGSAKVVASQGSAPSALPPTQGAALRGTAWNLVEMGGTADLAHILPTIDFGADGTVSGFAGCNTFAARSRRKGRSWR